MVLHRLLLAALSILLPAGPALAETQSNLAFWSVLSGIPRQRAFDCQLEIWTEKTTNRCADNSCHRRVWLRVRDARFDHVLALFSPQVPADHQPRLSHPAEIFTSEHASGLGWNRTVDLVLRTNRRGEVVALQMTGFSNTTMGEELREVRCSGHPRSLKQRERGY